MSVWLAKLRLGMHLMRGVWIVALRFPRYSAQQRRDVTRVWSVKLLRLAGMRLVVHNDQARLDHGALVVGNHISWIDIYAINAWRPTPFVSKAEVRKWPVIGWLAHRLDTVFIHREKRRDAQRAMHEMAERLGHGGVVCVFPEGTTSDGVELLPFHANLFQAAVSAGAPVQPICLLYEDAEGRQSTAPAYVGDVSLGQSVDAVLRNGPITVHLYVGEAIEAGNDRRVLAAKAREAVEGALRGMQANVGKPANLESAVRSEALGSAAGDAECGALDVSPTPRN
jgi:1-acyl-sn-glycerol-3-phosphate acyltransferase